AHAEEADPGREGARLERERAQHDVAARAAALDPRPLGVGAALAGEEPGRVDAVLPVDLAPAPVQEPPVLAAEPGAAAVVHVDDADAALREELRREIEAGSAVSGRAALTDDLEWWPLARRARRLRARGRVVE